MLVPGLLLLQSVSPRDWIQAREKSLQGWRKEHSLGHLHYPVKADGKCPKAAYTVNRK